MEVFALLLGLFLFVSAVVVPWIALIKAANAERRADALDAELKRLRLASRKEDAPAAASAQPARRAPEAPVEPPPLPPQAVPSAATLAVPERPVSPGEALEAAKVAHEAPPPLPEAAGRPPVCALVGDAPGKPVATEKPFNLEQFLGAKLFAWAGGVILFIAAAFGIKYSIEHAIIPPVVRAAFGFLTGIGLILGGLCLKREKYAVTRQSLSGAGTLILYAVTFACASDRMWNLIPESVAFGVMSAITATAFLIAVRLRAPAVAIIGLAGGFLTPPLLATGHDRPFGLFGYIALLDLGLLAIALRRHWHFLAPLGAIGTLLTQLVWWAKFYSDGGYAHSEKVFIPMGVFLAFQAIFLTAAHIAKRRERTNGLLTGSALALAGSALLAAVPFVGAPFLGDMPAVPFTYAFLVEAGVFALALADRRVRAAGPIAGGVVFLLLGGWTIDLLTPDNLNTGLALYLAFAVVHTAIPLALRRMGKIAETPAWCQAFPVLALLLTLVPAFRFDSLLVWPLLLLVDALAVVLAVATAALTPVLIVLVITLIAAGATLSHVGADLAGLNTWLILLGGVSVGFIALGAWLAKKFTAAQPDGATTDTQTTNALVAKALAPASALLPFGLLLMATAQLPLRNPSPVFGLALLLGVLLLGLGNLLRMGALAPAALAGTAALEFVWMTRHLETGMSPALPLGWNLAFCSLFFAYPFIHHRNFSDKLAPWVASVTSLGVHFLLMHSTIGRLAPHDYPGLEPALFALPAFAGLALILRRTPQESPERLSQTALFGGTALAFITLIFPLQFERQWLTLAWALEGAALCALFRRVPHAGLRLVGVALLGAAFARLALNPAVLGYHARGELPIWNWYLYAYGLAAASLFAGARLLAPPRNLVMGSDVPPVLRGMGVTLLFLLLNIEIADFFSDPGARVLTFEFSGNLARDMTYSLGWGLFALTLLATGILRKLRPARFAAIGLLVITIGKLLLHDLANLDQLYRIGATLGVAVILIVAAVLYQMFLGEERR